MVGLYSTVHRITRRAPVGIQFRYNHDDRINRPPHSFFPCCLLLLSSSGATFGPPLALRPLRTVRFVSPEDLGDGKWLKGKGGLFMALMGRELTKAVVFVLAVVIIRV